VLLAKDPFANWKFDKKTPVNEDQTLFTFELNYYQSGLNDIETLFEGERMIGNVKMTR
jgi:hypothetical protein